MARLFGGESSNEREAGGRIVRFGKARASFVAHRSEPPRRPEPDPETIASRCGAVRSIGSGRPRPRSRTVLAGLKAPPRDDAFLQIVAKPRRGAEPKLTRVAFKVSRLMEFCSERELQNQTGHSVYEWPL